MAATSASHVLITLEDAFVTAHRGGGSQGDHQTLEIQARGQFDGTNAPIAYEKSKAMETA